MTHKKATNKALRNAFRSPPGPYGRVLYHVDTEFSSDTTAGSNVVNRPTSVKLYMKLSKEDTEDGLTEAWLIDDMKDRCDQIVNDIDWICIDETVTDKAKSISDVLYRTISSACAGDDDEERPAIQAQVPPTGSDAYSRLMALMEARSNQKTTRKSDEPAHDGLIGFTWTIKSKTHFANPKFGDVGTPLRWNGSEQNDGLCNEDEFATILSRQQSTADWLRLTRALWRQGILTRQEFTSLTRCPD